MIELKGRIPYVNHKICSENYNCIVIDYMTKIFGTSEPQQL